MSLSEKLPTACNLADKQCQACKGGVEPLRGEQLTKLAEQVPGWDVIEYHHLKRTWRFADFAEALAFVNRVGEIAEQENHHPVINFGWGRVTVKVWTHKIDGLHESDFVLAAKISRMSV